MKTDKKSAHQKKVNSADLDAVCSCGSGELSGACCKSTELCSCGSKEMAGECCYAPDNDEEE